MRSYPEIIVARKSFKDPSDEDCLELAKIFERQNGQLYVLEQAGKVGDGLISIFLTLQTVERS